MTFLILLVLIMFLYWDLHHLAKITIMFFDSDCQHQLKQNPLLSKITATFPRGQYVKSTALPTALQNINEDHGWLKYLCEKYPTSSSHCSYKPGKVMEFKTCLQKSLNLMLAWKMAFILAKLLKISESHWKISILRNWTHYHVSFGNDL